MGNADFSVNYTKLAHIAKEMEECAGEIGVNINKVREKLENMNAYWGGVRYNRVIKQFNDVVPNLNKMMETFMSRVPEELEKAASKYKLADTGVRDAVSGKYYTKISDIAIKEVPGAHYNSNKVIEINEAVKAGFIEIIDSAKEFRDVFMKSVEWEGNAREKWNDELNSVIKNAEDKITTFNDLFTKLINEADEAMNKTENANTIQ